MTTGRWLPPQFVLLLFLGTGPVAAQSQPSPSPSPSPTSVEERVAATESTLARILRTTVTGYVQARATDQDTAVPRSNLFVRRARLNLRHSFDRGRFALSFDGGQNTVTVKDAYLDLFLTKSVGQRQGLTLRSGQFFRPFGFEVERGAPDREFPERPTGWTALFPGNRDQGFDLSVGLNAALIANVAIVNGGGTSTPALSFRDADDHKDLMARLRYSLFSPRIDLAVSVYRGEQTAAGTPVVVSDRNRWGVAVNVYDLVGGTLRAEYVGADDLSISLAAGLTPGAAPARAWYALYVHPVGINYGLAVRYDEFDPDTDDTLRLDGDGEVRTLGALVMRQLGEPIRLTLAWERPWVTLYDRNAKASTESRHDLWTLQVQYRF